jgi:N-formylglutamate amidohydrolase
MQQHEALGASEGPIFERALTDLDRPLLAVAVHDGRYVREEVRPRLALDERERRREEDPCSASWAALSPNRLVALRSRFEVDLNRAPELAVYLRPEDAWGLRVWRSPPAREIVERSLAEHAAFYRAARETIAILAERHRRVLVLDLHSYNPRRDGRADPPQVSPELNVGTGSMERARWSRVVEAFIAGTRGCGVDARENVRFLGGYFPMWVHRTFPERACALALEVKKTFMDEHTGEVDREQLARWRAILEAGTSAALDALEAP